MGNLVFQAGLPDLPFGGVGGSGQGAYHGKLGFQNFSHMRSFVESPNSNTFNGQLLYFDKSDTETGNNKNLANFKRIEKFAFKNPAYYARGGMKLILAVVILFGMMKLGVVDFPIFTSKL